MPFVVLHTRLIFAHIISGGGDDVCLASCQSTIFISTRNFYSTISRMTMTKAFSLLIGFSTLFQIANAATECVLSNPITIKDGLTLQQVQNSADGTYSMRLTYTGGQSWIGIGINEEGKSKMSPANAVIGRVEDDGSTSVLHYRMTSDDKDASGVQPYDLNT